MREYLRNLRKHVGHMPILVCGASVIVENRNVDIMYICKEYEGEAKADFIESDDVRFFPVGDLPDNISPPCVQGLNEYRRKRMP